MGSAGAAAGVSVVVGASSVTSLVVVGSGEGSLEAPLPFHRPANPLRDLRFSFFVCSNHQHGIWDWNLPALASAGVSATADSVAAGAVSAAAGVDSTAAVVSAATASGAADVSSGASVVASFGVAVSLDEPVNFWKLPEIRRVHLPGRFVSSPETAPSSSDVTASDLWPAGVRKLNKLKDTSSHILEVCKGFLVLVTLLDSRASEFRLLYTSFNFGLPFLSVVWVSSIKFIVTHNFSFNGEMTIMNGNTSYIRLHIRRS